MGPFSVGRQAAAQRVGHRRRLLVTCLAVIWVMTTAAAANAADADTGRHYVVQPLSPDRPAESLFDVSARTLGDGRRYREIVALNDERLQADGGMLSDPMAPLRPGWILALPADARGPEARTGPLPPGLQPSASIAAQGNDLRWQMAGGIAAVCVVTLLLAFARATFLRARRPGRPAVRPPVALAAGSWSSSAPEYGPETEAAQATASSSGGRPDPDTDNPESDLQVTVTNGHDLIEIILSDAAHAVAWLRDDEWWEQARIPVRLGEQQGWWLWVDLAEVPDVLTVAGADEARTRCASDICAQIAAAGSHPVVVAGALRASRHSDVRLLDEFVDLEPMLTGAPDPIVVFVAELAAADRRALRRWSADGATAVIPIVVGDVIRASWSLSVAPNL
jgi:hypothetical protein